MAEREQIRKTRQTDSEPSPRAEGVETPAGAERGSEIKAELDDLLDEIDEVLETNAEDFVKSYVQKGGQ